MMFVGTFVSLTSHDRLTLVLGGIIGICGVLLITCSLIYQFGIIKPKVYRFIHLFKKADTRDCETEIVKRLTKEEITQLRKLQCNQTIDQIFDRGRDPVLIDARSILKIDMWRHVKIVGWVYASNEDEAIQILLHEQFINADDLEEDTPDFFD
jgi:hypothetical protein